jgi:hypothetical protein
VYDGIKDSERQAVRRLVQSACLVGVDGVAEWARVCWSRSVVAPPFPFQGDPLAVREGDYGRPDGTRTTEPDVYKGVDTSAAMRAPSECGWKRLKRRSVAESVDSAASAAGLKQACLLEVLGASSAAAGGSHGCSCTVGGLARAGPEAGRDKRRLPRIKRLTGAMPAFLGRGAASVVENGSWVPRERHLDGYTVCLEIGRRTSLLASGRGSRLEFRAAALLGSFAPGGRSGQVVAAAVMTARGGPQTELPCPRCGSLDWAYELQAVSFVSGGGVRYVRRRYWRCRCRECIRRRDRGRVRQARVASLPMFSESAVDGLELEPRAGRGTL